MALVDPGIHPADGRYAYPNMMGGIAARPPSTFTNPLAGLHPAAQAALVAAGVHGSQVGMAPHRAVLIGQSGGQPNPPAGVTWPYHPAGAQSSFGPVPGSPMHRLGYQVGQALVQHLQGGGATPGPVQQMGGANQGYPTLSPVDANTLVNYLQGVY